MNKSYSEYKGAHRYFMLDKIDVKGPLGSRRLASLSDVKYNRVSYLGIFIRHQWYVHGLLNTHGLICCIWRQIKEATFRGLFHRVINTLVNMLHRKCYHGTLRKDNTIKFTPMKIQRSIDVIAQIRFHKDMWPIAETLEHIYKILTDVISRQSRYFTSWLYFRTVKTEKLFIIPFFQRYYIIYWNFIIWKSHTSSL